MSSEARAPAFPGPPRDEAILEPKRADRASRDAAITLGLTLPTDTVLYLLLPLHAAAFGVTLAEAGLLLAANRLVRILGYGWVARGYERHGARRACIAAVLGSAASSLGYALLPGVWWLLAARLVWGISFAAMNIATQALAIAEAEGAACRSGRAAGGVPGPGRGRPARPALRLAPARWARAARPWQAALRTAVAP